MNSRYAVLPGTFDPPTMGHIDIIERSSQLYEKVFVVIADNRSKKTLFTAEERKEMMDKVFAEHTNIEVYIWDGLVVEFARQHDIGVMIRGVRALEDFGSEFELAEINKQICPEIEVLFMPTNPKYFLLRSSTIKEMATFGAEINKLVPELVAEKVIAKLKS